MSQQTKARIRSLATQQAERSSPARNSGSSPSIHSPVEQILYLQRTHGNQATQRLFESGIIQPKPLQISSPFQRQVEEKEEEPLQPKRREGETFSITSAVESSISSQMGSGRSLSESERTFFEPRFKRDFSRVRLHTDEQAGTLAKTVQARAFTVGREIFFGAGQHAPGRFESRKLLAHELTHVVQQNSRGSHIQCKKLSKEEKAADLQSDELKHDARLQTAYDNAPVMGAPETSEGVKTLQRALKKLGYDLTISFAKTGDADGIFGKETRKAVLQFQVDHKLQHQDGKAGRETLLTLDEIYRGSQTACSIKYIGDTLGFQERSRFLQSNFSATDRPSAEKILDDLCEVKQPVMSFESEQELRDEVLKRLRISQYMKESQTAGAFAYPESSTACPGKTGNSLADAQVNAAAKDYWHGPVLEERAAIKNRHYFFELTSDKGKQNGYEALKLLFTPQDNICNKTLIHCDTLITLVKELAYADTIGRERFNERIKSGQLSMWLTYDGLSVKDNDPSQTPVSVSFYWVEPASEDDLVIGDHVVFWNHLAYDAISVTRPGPWRLENALLVDKDPSGRDLFEGHGAPTVGGSVKPGSEDDVLKDLMNVYNSYAKSALSLADRVDRNEPGSQKDLTDHYPQVKKINDRWWIEELDRNKDRPRRFYLLREINDVNDIELIGLRNPYNPARMNAVQRPVESK